MNRNERFIYVFNSLVGNPRTKPGKAKMFQSAKQYCESMGDDFKEISRVLEHSIEPTDLMCSRLSTMAKVSASWIKNGGKGDPRVDAIERRICAVELSVA